MLGAEVVVELDESAECRALAAVGDGEADVCGDRRRVVSLAARMRVPALTITSEHPIYQIPPRGPGAGHSVVGGEPGPLRVPVFGGT